MRRPEEAAHRAIVEHLRLRLLPPWMFWHTPNGGGRSRAEAGILKAMGTMAGIPDLFVLGPNCNLIGLEVKAPPKVLKSGVRSTANQLSETQKVVFPKLAALGCPVIVVTDPDEAVMVLSSLGAKFRGRAL